MTAGLHIDDLFKRLREDEGLVLKIYKCPAGKRTIGYGHNIEAKGLPDYIDHHLSLHGEITKEMAEYLLDRDLSDAIEEAKSSVYAATWDVLTPNQRGCLALMAFQMGGPGLRKFRKMVSCIERGNMAGAILEGKDSEWFRTCTERAKKTLRMLGE